MSFLMFLGYFLTSMFIWRLINIGIIVILKYMAKKRVEKAIKDGRIKMISLEELDELTNDGKKTWN